MSESDMMASSSLDDAGPEQVSSSSQSPSWFLPSMAPLPPSREPDDILLSPFGSNRMSDRDYSADLGSSSNGQAANAVDGASLSSPRSQVGRAPAHLHKRQFRFLGLRWRFLKPQTAREVLPPPASVAARRMRPRRHLGRYIINDNQDVPPEVVELEERIKMEFEKSANRNREKDSLHSDDSYSSADTNDYYEAYSDMDSENPEEWTDGDAAPSWMRAPEPAAVFNPEFDLSDDLIRQKNAEIFFRKGVLTSNNAAESVMTKVSPRAAAAAPPGAPGRIQALHPAVSPKAPSSPRPSNSLKNSTAPKTKREIMEDYYKSVVSKSNADPDARRSKLMENRLNKLEISRTFKEFLVDKGHRVPKFMSGVKIDATSTEKVHDASPDVEGDAAAPFSMSLRPSASVLSTAGMSVRSGASRQSSFAAFR